MKRYTKILVPLFAIFEMLAIALAAYIAITIRYGSDLHPTTIHETILFISVGMWPILSSATSYYKDRRTWSFSRLLGHLSVQWFAISFILFAYLVLTKSDISRLTFSTFLTLGYIFLIISSRFRYIFLINIRKRGMNQRRIVFVGQQDQVDSFSQWLHSNPSFGYSLMSFIDVGLSDSMVNPLNVLEKLLVSEHTEEILIAPFESRRTILTELVDVAEEHGCRVWIIQEREDVYTRQLGLHPFGPYQVFSVREEPLSHPPAKIFKRIFDITFASLVLIVLYWWIHLIISAIIKLSSKGPIFFKQKRVGRGGREFYCIKFRTMTLNGSTCEGQGEITKQEDSRITPVGKFLRKTNLDEFPQFINVLMGDMSVIGPRPHMLEEDHKVAKELRKYRIRRFVRPGISGWAQVNGYRGGTEDMTLMQKRVDYDIDYIESWTPWFDIKIIYFTVIQMLTGRTGAH